MVGLSPDQPNNIFQLHKIETDPFRSRAVHWELNDLSILFNMLNNFVVLIDILIDFLSIKEEKTTLIFQCDFIEVIIATDLFMEYLNEVTL